MKRHGSTPLVAVVFLAFLGLVFSSPTFVGADDTLRLKSVDFPREFKGECDVVFKVEGDLSSAKDVVAEVEYTKQQGGKGSNQAKMDKSTIKHKAKSIDAKIGVVTFHPRFNSPGERMATCTLLYVKDGKALKTNEVKTSWFRVTEGARTISKEDE